MSAWPSHCVARWNDALPTGIGTPSPGTPSVRGAVMLAAPSPNPTRGVATIRYTLRHEATVALRVFNAGGGLVAEIDHGRQTAGPHVATWNGRASAGRRVAPGVYFVRLEANGVVVSRRLLHL